MKQLITILHIFIIATVVWLLYLVFNPLICPIDDASNYVEFCGVENKSEVQNKLYLKGKTHFRDSCAQCHSMKLSHYATGPPLQNAFIRWKNDTLNFSKYINSSSVFIAENPNNFSWVKEGEFELNENTHRNNFNEDQIRGILQFLEFESQ